MFQRPEISGHARIPVSVYAVSRAVRELRRVRSPTYQLTREGPPNIAANVAVPVYGAFAPAQQRGDEANDGITRRFDRLSRTL